MKKKDVTPILAMIMVKIIQYTTLISAAVFIFGGPIFGKTITVIAMLIMFLGLIIWVIPLSGIPLNLPLDYFKD